MKNHAIGIESDNGDEIVFICPDQTCQRKLIVKRSGGLTVLNQGDFFIRHVYCNDDIEVDSALQ